MFSTNLNQKQLYWQQLIPLKVTNTSKDVHVYDDVELLIQWLHWPCLYKVKENSKWKPKVHLTQYLLRKQPMCCTQNIGLFINCIHCRLSCCSSPWETFTLIDLLSPLLDLSFALVKKKAKLETSERSRFNGLSFIFVSRPQFIKHLPFGALLCWHCSDKQMLVVVFVWRRHRKFDLLHKMFFCKERRNDGCTSKILELRSPMSHQPRKWPTKKAPEGCPKAPFESSAHCVVD